MKKLEAPQVSKQPDGLKLRTCSFFFKFFLLRSNESSPSPGFLFQRTVIAKFEHLEKTIESIKEKRKERTRKETNSEERTNKTEGKKHKKMKCKSRCKISFDSDKELERRMKK